MKNNKFLFIIVVLLLTLASLTACDNKSGEECSHNIISSYDVIEPANCSTPELQLAICADCGETFTRYYGEPLRHSFSGWETDVEPTCISYKIYSRTCNLCGFTETTSGTEKAPHSYSAPITIQEPTCVSTGIGKIVCTVCGEESTCTIEKNNSHEFEDVWQYNESSRKFYRNCIRDCGKTKEILFDDIFTTDGNGTIEFIDAEINEDGRLLVYVMPVANDGYYFLNWCSETGGEYYHAIWTYYLSSNSDNKKIKAVFTNDSSLIQPVEYVIQAENDLDVEVKYLPYTYKGEQTASFYVKENDDVFLLEAIASVTSSNGGGMGVTFVRNTILPVEAHSYVTSFIDESHNLTHVILKFADISEKHVISISPKCVNPKHVYIGEEYIFADENGIATINTWPMESWLSSNMFLGWADEDGNIISYEEEFSLTVTEDTKIFMLVDNYDVSVKTDKSELYFIENDDDTLTFMGFGRSDQYGEIEIPSEVDGKAVTDIGMLLCYTMFDGTIIVPDSVTNIHPYAFKTLGANGYRQVCVEFLTDRTDLEASDFYGCNENIYFYFTEATLKSMATNELKKLANDNVEIIVSFSDEMESGVLGYYVNGTKDITLPVLDEGYYYSRNILNVLVHEVRHYYQSIAIGDVEGYSVSDLKVVPTDNQIGAWKYLDYTQSDEDYEKYYYNAREIDAREYAESVVGFSIE